MDWLRSAWAWAQDADWKTWVGHGLVGFLLALLFGPVFVAGAFVYREVSDIVNWWGGDRTRPFRDKLRDGFFDLWSPLVGAALAEALKLWV